MEDNHLKIKVLIRSDHGAAEQVDQVLGVAHGDVWLNGHAQGPWYRASSTQRNLRSWDRMAQHSVVLGLAGSMSRLNLMASSVSATPGL